MESTREVKGGDTSIYPRRLIAQQTYTPPYGTISASASPAARARASTAPSEDGPIKTCFILTSTVWILSRSSKDYKRILVPKGNIGSFKRNMVFHTYN